VGIKAVGLDLDGTLYPAWLMYAVSADIGIRHPLLLRAFGAARRAARQGGADPTPDNASAEKPLSPSSAFKTRQAAIVAKSLGASPAKIAESLDTIVYKAIEYRFGLIRPFKGAAACLSALRAAGLPLGLLSDLPPSKKLELLGFGGYFDLVLCAEDFGALKPDPRPFFALSKGFGIEPESILYVGNKREYDIVGAKGAGMKTALIGKGKQHEADFAFTKWEDLTTWILANRD
jgi:putative hydrolase of the HAD superfamily